MLKDIRIHVYFFCVHPRRRPEDGVDVNFFGTHTISATSEKKTGSLTRIIYLPSLKLLIFGQIHDFHLWDTLHFLGTIEYSMVPKIFTIVKYEVSAF